MGNFRALRAWQEAKRLALLSGDAIDKLPRHERFALAEQWRRAAYSVPLNLAEGAAQRSPKEFRRYVRLARGSLDELEAILAIVEGMAYLDVDHLNQIIQSRSNCVRMVAGLLHKLDQIVAQ